MKAWILVALSSSNFWWTRARYLQENEDVQRMDARKTAAALNSRSTAFPPQCNAANELPCLGFLPLLTLQRQLLLLHGLSSSCLGEPVVLPPMHLPRLPYLQHDNPR